MPENPHPRTPRDAANFEDNINLNDYLRLIIRRRRQIAYVWIFCVAVVLLYCIVSTSKYEAVSVIILDQDAAAPTGLANVMGGMPLMAMMTGAISNEDYQTAIETLESRSVTWSVIQRLKLEDNKDFFSKTSVLVRLFKNYDEDPAALKNDMIKVFEKNLRIDRLKSSQCIKICYLSKNPELAAAIVNTIIEAYRDHAYAMKIDSIRYSNDWLKANLEQERTKLATAEQALLAYQEKNNILLDLSKDAENTNMAMKKLSELSVLGVMAGGERVEAETRYRQAAAVADRPEKLDSVPEIQESALITGIKTMEAELLQRRSELSKKYGPLHPQMKAVEAELKTMRAKKEQEIKRVISALENAYLAKLAKEKTVQDELDALKAEFFRQGKNAPEFTRLYVDAAAARATYGILLRQLKESESKEEFKVPNFRVIDKAEPPTEVAIPKSLKYMVLAIIVGLVVGIIWAFILERVVGAVNDPDDIAQVSQLPFLGSVPDMAKPGRTGAGRAPAAAMAVARSPRSSMAEAYRRIRANILLSRSDTGPGIIMVSGVHAGAGATTAACNIAAVLAQYGCRVALVDANLQQPQLHSLFNIRNDAGLTDLLVGARGITDVASETDIPGLQLISAGSVPPNPSEMLSSPKMKAVVVQLRQHFDKIIIDAPASSDFADTLVAAGYTDGAVLVVRSGVTTRNSLTGVVDGFQKAGVHLYGAVLNAVDINVSNFSLKNLRLTRRFPFITWTV
ncbi:MAG: polysaccharide biosynthesis tyrosine autokinase [Deltaproteobacteria bacterium]|nr:polysaccharide biosynthesis tyrosine autokinase [Deltaproteobacteria bacterium]